MNFLTVKTFTRKHINFFLVLLIIALYSCSDDFSTNTHFQEIEVDSRAVGDTLTDSEIEWLDTFRLNLKNSSWDLNYQVDDAVYGMEALFNLLPGHGSKDIDSLYTRKRIKTYTISDDSIAKSELRDMFDDIYDSIDSFYSDLTVDNKSFLFTDINIAGDNGTSMDICFDTYIGDAVSVSTPSSYDLSNCSGGFSTGDCYKSAVGGWYDDTVYGGGDCDGKDEDEVSAQLVVQNEINDNIPDILKNKFGTVGYIVYEEIECTGVIEPGDLELYNENYGPSGCEGFSFRATLNDIDQVKHDSDELNCAQCIIEGYINSIVPTGMTLTSVNLWGDQIPSGSTPSSVYWRGEFCFGVPVIVPVHTPGPFPFNNGDSILGDSFSDKF